MYSDAKKLTEMYCALERALEEANEALRSRDKQIEDLKRERDFAMADRNSRRLVRDLEEANEALRSRDKQIENLRRERDFAMADRNSPRSVRDLPPDNHVDAFEGDSFNDRHPIIIVEEEGGPGKEKPDGAGKDGEFDAEKVLRNNDLNERSILITEALHSPTPPIQRRLLESPPTLTNANADMAPLPNVTPLAIPDIPTQVPAPPPTLSTDVVAKAAAAAFPPYRHDEHQSFQPKQRRQRANVVRARPKKTDIPVSEPDHRLMDDHNEENINNIHGEGFDNCPWDPVNIDNGNHNGPRLIKTVSYITCRRTPKLTKRRSAVKIFTFNDIVDMTRSLASLK
jgi:hypothetical protein